MVKANVDYWTPYSTFEQGACGVLSAATDLGYEIGGIKQSLTKVGIHYESCDPYAINNIRWASVLRLSEA